MQDFAPVPGEWSPNRFLICVHVERLVAGDDFPFLAEKAIFLILHRREQECLLHGGLYGGVAQERALASGVVCSLVIIVRAADGDRLMLDDGLLFLFLFPHHLGRLFAAARAHRVPPLTDAAGEGGIDDFLVRRGAREILVPPVGPV